MGGLTKGLFGGSSSKQRSGLDPRFADAFFDNLQSTQGVADNLDVREFAGRTQDFQQGEDAMRNNAMGGMGANQQAQQMAQQGSNFLQGDIAQYMNPYQDQVIDRTMQDMERQRQMQTNNIGDRAAAAGAFGGSRHGVAEAETNRGFADQMGNMSAQLRNQGFDTASNLMGQNMDRQLQGAGLMGQLGQQQQQMGMQGSQALMNLGLGQQQFGQQQLDAQRNLGMERQQLLNQSLGINPGGGAGMTSSGQSSSSPGLLGGFGQFAGNMFPG